MPPLSTRPSRRRGVAIGLVSTALLIAFAFVFFTLGKYSASWEPSHQQHAKLPKEEVQKVGDGDVADQTATPNTDSSLQRVDVVPSEQTQTEQQDSGGSGAVAPSIAAGSSDSKQDQHKLTRERVQAIQQDGYVVVTWANWHYQDFVMTWVAHVKRVGITGYIVGAMDEHLLQVLTEQKINTFSMQSGLTTGDFGWGSKTFAKMGREKIRLIALFLQLGVNVVIADVDVIWLRNPLPYFSQYPEADVLSSSDLLENTVKDESLEVWPRASAAANIGIMLFRENSLDFVNEWIRIIEADDTIWDQNAFNNLFKNGTITLPDDPKHYFMGYQGTLKMGILPVSVFCSGHTYFTQRMYQMLKLQPYAVHATFQFSGTPGKRNRMREFMLFEDPPSYYDHEAGFVSFKMDGVQGPLLDNSGPATRMANLGNVQGHFKLMNHQILRIRSALAISSVLGRALVVPELWCGLDRYWGPHSGTIPGSNFTLPFRCPLDHVFDLEGGWAQNLPSDHYGPNIGFRESSFFQNPRMPAAINGSRLTVEICPAGQKDGCSDGKTPAPVQGGKVRIQEGLLSEELKVALQGAASYKILEFSTMSNAFKNFTNERDWSLFSSRMKIYGSIWCCVQAHPGHIHYDLLWDLPHSDRFNRIWNGTWEPKTGP